MWWSKAHTMSAGTLHIAEQQRLMWACANAEDSPEASLLAYTNYRLIRFLVVYTSSGLCGRFTRLFKRQTDFAIMQIAHVAAHIFGPFIPPFVWLQLSNEIIKLSIDDVCSIVFHRGWSFIEILSSELLRVNIYFEILNIHRLRKDIMFRHMKM